MTEFSRMSALVIGLGLEFFRPLADGIGHSPKNFRLEQASLRVHHSVAVRGVESHV